MGSFALWHWLIALIVIGIPALIIGLLIWLVVRVTRRPRSAASAPAAPAMPAPPVGSAEARLQELVVLNSKGVITDAEYEQQRAAILKSV